MSHFSFKPEIYENPFCHQITNTPNRHPTDTKVYAKALVPFLVTWCFGGIF